MKKVALTAAAMAAFLLVGCTHEVCETIGSRTTCETQFKPSQAEKDRELDNALYTIDWMSCVEYGEGSRQYCQAQARKNAAN